MLANTVIFTAGVLLAASCFVAPLVFKSTNRIHRIVFVVGLYLAVFLGFLTFYGVGAAVAVLVLGAFFAGLASLLALNYEMVHVHHDPKDRHCY